MTMPSEARHAAGTRQSSEFTALARMVQASGLLDRRPAWYAATFARNAVLCGIAVTAFVWLGPSWWQMLTAAFLALVSTQLAFIGHDAGHKQIFRSRRANDIVGYVHGGLVGMSYGDWVHNHNRHHANPNHEDDDPDIDIPVLAFTPAQAEAKRGPLRWIAAHQAVFFFPLLLLEGLSLHRTAALAVLNRRIPAIRLEAVLLVAHVGGYLTAVFWVLTPLQGIVFVAVHQGLWGLFMSLAFAPNHKGMPTVAAGEKPGHLRKQVRTSRNVRGGAATDFLMGGLNYQIEHHLFPSMPRPNLRRAQQMVRDYCVGLGIAYTETTAIDSYAQVVRHLHAVGATLRVAPAPAAPAPPA